MVITIADVLSPVDVQDIRSTLAAMRFEDGRATAGWSAKLVKENEQAKEGPALGLLRERVSKAILSNVVFSLAARPKALTPLLFSRYGGGQHYGTHVDNPLMDGIRTDVSFTLFLVDPDSYHGGELVIESVSGEEEVKLPAGFLVAYPSTSLHRVAPVTRGERLVAVSWAQSYVRDSARREMLFDLENAKRGLFATSGKTPEFDLLAKTSANLFRMWAET
ncbi:Fe2+-dependent dioxygenase [Microvirga arsenatis]|uniref:Fe2+-dependent dioxygenase n=1 Tax=Microvirga arsenatis TaxID=2692265 RepID=A0ABW9Z772_9HYPH|nr:Fe2+-dependent dioxygenase [Microvirga arsenatis]NBJ13026.1 Fe2+-dependent dioxygenase [Microvirga arsenatis]NBJ26751.1 Fe2+-dependent dioxygenase [Microvirga arsenatis]